jgi:cytochrome c5
MAVLAEHVMSGYLQMPERGGDVNLSDADAQAATEYMLLLTYPDRPAD